MHGLNTIRRLNGEATSPEYASAEVTYTSVAANTRIAHSNGMNHLQTREGNKWVTRITMPNPRPQPAGVTIVGHS